MVVTLGLYNHSNPSGNPLPDKMDLTLKSSHAFTVGALTGLIMTNYDTHKVTLFHLQVNPNQPKQRSGLLFHSSL